MKLEKKTILITGVAGFIGAYLAKRFLELKNNSLHIIGIDNLNNYYEVSLKEDRLKMIRNVVPHDEAENFVFLKGDIADREFVQNIFNQYKPEIVVNLAAQAGVRYSIENPQVYMESNMMGFFNILEACRNSYEQMEKGVQHLIYASSSSVYGNNKKVPYSERDKVDTPVSLYAATKKSNELMAHAYSKLYGIPTTGLRFFTVYGPMGRPDMAYFSFANNMVIGEKIQLFNHGDMYRDFTYIDDIIEGVVRVIQSPPKENGDGIRYKIYNIGNNNPHSLLYFVDTLEKCLIEEGIIGETVQREFRPMQMGDVYKTYADIESLSSDFGFVPKTSLENGLREFAKWYKAYYL